MGNHTAARQLAGMSAQDRIREVAAGRATAAEVVKQARQVHGFYGIQHMAHPEALFDGAIPEGLRDAAEAVASACRRCLEGLPAHAFFYASRRLRRR